MKTNLRIPKYLETSRCQDNSVRYAWDDWHERPELREADKELVARLTSVSQRAVLAFACGSAEWIVYRFDRLTDTAASWNFIEAAWAMIVHIRYGTGPESWSYYSGKAWGGPIRGPIRKALEYLESTFHLLSSEYHTDPSIVTSKISNLASYVIADPTPYKNWSDQLLNRFEALYPRNSEDPLGDVVPRQAVDPEIPFQTEQTETLINSFLAGLDYRSNTFLCPSDEMLEPAEGEEKFEGHPYTFDTELDRTTRPRRKSNGHHH